MKVLRSLWVSGVVLIIGIVRDQIWHATHNTQRQFESVAIQGEVHWILWLGVIACIVVATIGLRRRDPGYLGYLIVSRSGIVYLLLSVWHAWEHAQLRDPTLVHVLLAVALLGIYSGIALASFARRAAAHPAS